MKDPAMRAAVRDVINRQQIVDNVYEKRADVAQGFWAQPCHGPHPCANR